MDLRRPPSQLFHTPLLMPGLAYIQSPGWLVRPARRARVELVAASDVPELQEAMENANRRYVAGMLEQAIEVAVSPVVMRDAVFRNSYAQIDGRYVLNGASGDRLRTKFDASNKAGWRQDRLVEYFRRGRRRSSDLHADTAPASRRKPVAIEMKNGTNFYHFLTETLGHLACFLDDDSNEPITLHHGGSEVRGFVPGFVQTVFPEIAHRIRFAARRGKFDKVRSVYNHRHYLYQVNDPLVEQALAAPGMDPRWMRLHRDPRGVKRLRMNAFDSGQRMLRETALSRLDPAMLRDLPKRIYVARAESSEAARARGVQGQAALLEALEAQGFQRVYFETMTPLMQIASMQAADIMISPHGAGFANMLFARPDTLVIELANRQTQLHRWGDFLSVAHAAGCRYATIFADVNSDDPGSVPAIKDGHLGIGIGRRALEAIMALVESYAPASSSPRSS